MSERRMLNIFFQLSRKTLNSELEDYDLSQVSYLRFWTPNIDDKFGNPDAIYVATRVCLIT